MTEIPERIPVSYLRKRLLYEKETGKLFWKDRPISDFKDKRSFGNWRTRFSGKTALISKHRDGYLIGEIAFQGKRYSVSSHIIIWAMLTGSYPNEEIDHINGERSDNRIENLREATRAQNNYNSIKKGKYLSGTSPTGNKWKASITVDRKQTYIGVFETEKDAHDAYITASIKIRKEFSPYRRDGIPKITVDM